jgi:probable blue pigment (indigoidine) exporter
MEATLPLRSATAIAPVAWGSTYYVTQAFLPTGSPLWGAVFRAVPAGLVLLLVCRRLPSGSWWWRSAVLGTMNMGAFFGLLFVAAQRLPSSTASMVMANSPVALMLIAWIVLAERPRARALAGAMVGIAGAALMLGGGAGGVDPLGILASVSAMLLASFGFALAKRWGSGAEGTAAPGVVPTTAWQLLAGGLVLLPAAAVVHGPPPALDGPAVTGFAYVSLVATAVAYLAWFTGLRRLPAGTVGLIGLLNPLTGVLLGTMLAGEGLTFAQVVGIGLVLGGVLAGSGAGPRRLRVVQASRDGDHPIPARSTAMVRASSSGLPPIGTGVKSVAPDSAISPRASRTNASSPTIDRSPRPSTPSMSIIAR